MGERGAQNEPATADDIARHGGARARSGSRPVRSASRRRARSCTARSTASRCPARSRPRTSCSESGACWASSGAGSSRSRAPARRARTSRARCARSTGCGGSPPRSAARSRSRMLQFDAAPELWRELLEYSAAAVARRRADLSAGRRPAVRLADRPPDRDPSVLGPAELGFAALASVRRAHRAAARARAEARASSPSA